MSSTSRNQIKYLPFVVKHSRAKHTDYSGPERRWVAQAVGTTRLVCAILLRDFATCMRYVVEHRMNIHFDQMHPIMTVTLAPWTRHMREVRMAR